MAVRERVYYSMLKIEEKEFAGGIMDNIILASASPRRKELLQLAGVSFTVLPATGEELKAILGKRELWL